MYQFVSESYLIGKELTADAIVESASTELNMLKGMISDGKNHLL